MLHSSHSWKNTAPSAQFPISVPRWDGGAEIACASVKADRGRMAAVEAAMFNLLESLYVYPPSFPDAVIAAVRDGLPPPAAKASPAPARDRFAS